MTKKLQDSQVIRAAHYSRLSRIFSFLSTEGSGRDSTIGLSFGLDNIAEIRITGSEKRFLEIRKQEASAKLESNFRKLVDVYNGVTDLYNKYTRAKGPNRALFYSVLGKYQTGKTLDAEKLIRAIDWALKFELGRNFVQHLHLITKSQMDRLLVRGNRYERIPQIVPINQELDRRNNKVKINENMEIDRDIDKGILDLERP